MTTALLDTCVLVPSRARDVLLDIFDLHPGQVVTAVRAIAGRTGKFGPTMTASEIATYLSTHGTPVHVRHASLRRATASDTQRRFLDRPLAQVGYSALTR